MVNLIAPNTSKPIPKSIESSRAQQTPIATNSERPAQPASATQKTASLLVQWANVESNKTLTAEQKVRLVELNPSLAKTLIGQIKGEPQSNNNALSSQNIALLKQSPVQMLALTLNNNAIKMVTPNNIDSLLNTNGNTQLPIVQTAKGWQIANTADLKTALQTAATQLLKQNLPLQTSSMPLFKIAQTLLAEQTNALTHLPKTQANIQGLASQAIDTEQTQNPQILGQTLKSQLKTSTAFMQIDTVLQSLNNETINNTKNLSQSTQALLGLEKSLQQLQSAITSNISEANKNSVTPLSNLQTMVGSIVQNKPALNSLQLTQTNQLINSITTIVENTQKGIAQEQLVTAITQQINTLLKPFNPLSNTVNTTANNALLQLLGMSVFGQQLDQQSLQQNVQRQLKNLLQQVGAKLQINQLSHLGLDTSRENPATLIQQLQGELPLRFNEQILPLTYHIQGYEEEKSKENSDEHSNEDREKTRRWQLFMSLDLPHNEILHCKLSLIDNHINTTLWAESETLCRKTQKLIGDLEARFTQAGLTVETLQCFAGKPPQDETSINYNLVDITT